MTVVLDLLSKTLLVLPQVTMKLSCLITTVLISHLLAGCLSNVQMPQSRLVSKNGIEDASCGPQTPATYSKLRKNEYGTEQIYQIIGKPSGDAVNMLELKQAAQHLGFEAEGYLLDPDKLERIETYAIIPIRENKTESRSDPLHFVLVRFSNGNVFKIERDTMQEKPLDVTSLRKVWKGPALFLR
jgi:ABC-type bacteriocin/lantibiotic exporter with double-glycine peptidase domain